MFDEESDVRPVTFLVCHHSRPIKPVLILKQRLVRTEIPESEAMHFTWERTSKPRPRLSANIRMMMLFRMVPKKVLIPNTRAHSSLVSEDAIWKLRRQKEEQTHEEVSAEKKNKPFQPSLIKWKLTRSYFNGHSRGYGHQELVKSPEENVGNVADPDVVCGAHEKEQSRLRCCDHSDDQLGPQIPTNFHKPSSEGRQCTWWRRLKILRVSPVFPCWSISLLIVTPVRARTFLSSSIIWILVQTTVTVCVCRPHCIKSSLKAVWS